MVYSGGKTCQKTKIGTLESESNTGSTSTGTAFLVSENHTGDLHMSADSCGFPADADKGEPNSHGSIEVISKELTLKDLKGLLRLGRKPYLHLDGRTTKESISVRSDLKSVSTTLPNTVEGKTPQITDVPSPDSESNTPQEDADSQEVQQASMESLPADIVQDILSRVPAESVLESKLVCKRWVTVIRGSNFANMHLHRQLNHLYEGSDGKDKLVATVEPCLFFACRIDDPDEFTALLFHGGQVSDRISGEEKYIYNQNLKRIYHPRMHIDPLFEHLVGSCNGLVCAYHLHNLVLDPIYICNPLTREYVYLPQLVVNKEDADPDRIKRGEVNLLHDMTCGFGYVRSTNEYKVVRIHYLNFEEGNVEVYTLGSGCGWRMKGKIPYRLETTRKGTYVNDAIYWISGKQVVAFDLANEEFRVLSSVPPCLPNRRVDDRCGLVALGRHLCLYMDKLHMEIWSLTECRDSKETWRMEFDIAYEAVVGSRKRNFQPVLLTKQGEIIFLHAESVLYSYDTKTTLLKMVSNKCTMDNLEDVDAIAHINTLASLEALGENSKRYTFRTPLDDVIHELDRVAVVDEEIDMTRFRLKSLS